MQEYRELTLYKCNDCGYEFVRGERCPSKDHKQVNFVEIGTHKVYEYKEFNYRDRVLELVSVGKFKDVDMRFISHIL